MILQGGGGGVVSIRKHAQNHDGLIIIDAFLHPKIVLSSILTFWSRTHILSLYSMF